MKVSAPPRRFLVIDHHRDSRFLLVKCLQRKFPDAHIDEAEEGEEAVALTAATRYSAIVTHRTREYLGTELVEILREQDNQVPIVMVSGIERSAPAIAAGADRFMLYDEWLRIGTIVKDLLDVGRRPHVVTLQIPPRPSSSTAKPSGSKEGQ